MVPPSDNDDRGHNQQQDTRQKPSSDNTTRGIPLRFRALTHTHAFIRAKKSVLNSREQSLCSVQNLMHDAAFDIGQAEIAAAVRICQTCMIDSALVQQCGMQVVKITDVFDRMDTELIC